MTSPFFFDCINVEDSFLLAVLDDIASRSAAGKVYKKTYFIDKNFVKDIFIVFSCESNLDELDLLVLIWKVLWFGVYHGHLVEFEVPFDQGDCSSTY